MTNTDTADPDATAIQVARLAHAGSRAVRVTVQHRYAGSGGGARDDAQGPRRASASTSRSSATSTTTATSCWWSTRRWHGAGEVPDQPRECRCETPRRALRDDRRGRDRQRQAGPDRCELGLARPGDPDRARWTSTPSTAEPRDARDVMIDAMMEPAMPLGRAGGVDRAHATTGSSSRQGVPGPRPRRRQPGCSRQRSDYPLHLGLTEAGMGDKGIIASTAWDSRSCSTRASATRSVSR